ncbi:hypothetical protein CEXT_361171 [Caerostris extrusa]|uniref:Uncharacterized protein n=1 Tax=Caerostris extrusa TaxID=172846 RepID=A0AAV4X065_CAEEX|nr:hypothetical protein CEXT_361171 [Caerostris extrusa]
MDYECYHHAMEVTSSNHSSRMLRLDYDNSGIRKLNPLKLTRAAYIRGDSDPDCGTQNIHVFKLEFMYSYAVSINTAAGCLCQSS